MAKTTLAVAEPKEVVEVRVTQKDLDDYLFGTGTKLSDQQKKLFYGIALTLNLNPLKREIYAVKYGDNFNIITGYEVYLKRAERTGLVDGWEAKVDGEGPKMIATCTVWRKDRSKPVSIDAWFTEYNTGQSLWKTKPRTMLRKVAIAQAFRMAFPDDLGGMPYTAEEIAGGAQTQEVEFTPLDQMAEQVADDDLKDRKDKAVKFLSGKGKSVADLESFLKRSFGDWTEGDLDELRAWSKAGFPEPATDADFDV